MKCGTTVLWRNLDQHPDIVMGKNWEDPKKTSTEIRFWNNQGPHHTWKRKGIDWYKTLFSGSCSGEKSANYIESQTVFERLHKYIPNAKLILCVRNPVDRYYSEYQMQRHTAPKKHTRGFDAALADKGYYRRGKYHNMLNDNVLPHFPKDQIYIVVQEKMFGDTKNELNKVYDFLHVKHVDIEIENIVADNRDKKMSRYRKWRTEYRPMSIAAQNKLIAYYKDHNKRFFDFLGYEVTEWKT